jgi:hypothetical protein
MTEGIENTDFAVVGSGSSGMTAALSAAEGGAGGMDAGGLYGESYDVFATGGALGFAFNSGRIGARNALEFIGK